MELINYALLEGKKEQLKNEWRSRTCGFGYIVFDGMFKPDAAEEIYRNYPSIDQAAWSSTTYINQKNKFVKNKFDDSPFLQQVFDELNSDRFRALLEEITGIEPLLGDDKLFGGGLHQSIKGAFLDVHVDFNYHNESNLHRRMNVLVYMNKDWKESYNGYLELWDMNEKKQLEYVAPVFNRCVIFETNEVSFHGHPKPLSTPTGLSRKSLATYYYTKERPAHEIAPAHSTIHVNTEGVKGTVKSLQTGVKALLERINRKF